jgi:hypothetical protein
VSYWITQGKTNRRSWSVQVDLHGGPTSAITKPDPESTAYAHRDFLLMFSFNDRVDAGNYPATGFSFLQNFVRNVTVGMLDSDWGMYINYPDPKMDQTTAQAKYWGKHLEKLRSIKGTVDPGNLFHFPQGVMPG